MMVSAGQGHRRPAGQGPGVLQQDRSHLVGTKRLIGEQGEQSVPQCHLPSRDASAAVKGLGAAGDEALLESEIERQLEFHRLNQNTGILEADPVRVSDPRACPRSVR
jgi:hypothetical protein